MMERPKHKVLIVDDEPANLDLLCRVLRRDYEVRTALSGDEALELLKTERFAAILSDQRMPGMTGTEFLSQARRMVPDTVRMILTGYSAESDSLDAINQANVSSFLTKPVTPETVQRAVGDAVSVFELAMRHQALLVELEGKNRELDESRKLLELSLDERTRALLEANRRLESLALRDTQTGLYNHRFFQERLSDEVGRYARYQTPVSVVLADIDNFRAYNQAHGHQAGDKLLLAIAELFLGASRSSDAIIRFRPMDLVARFGGDEFAIVAPSTHKEGARVLTERLRAGLSSLEAPGLAAFPGGRLTASFGIASVPTDALERGSVVDAAQQALDRAKRAGRDRVETC